MMSTKFRFALLVLTFLGTLLGPTNSRTFASQCVDFFASDQLEARKTSWAYNAFSRDADVLEKFFVENRNLNEHELIEAAMKRGIRVVFFRLQSAAMVYSAQSPEFFDSLRREFKKYEDLFGRYDLALSLGKEARELGNHKLIAKAEAREREAYGNLSSALREGGWSTQPQEAASKLHRTLDQYRWQSGKEDKAFVQEQIIAGARELHKDVDKRKFDSDEIEKGLHELRRRLRWILIETASFNGYVRPVHESLKGDIRDWFEELNKEESDILQDKYIMFDKPIVPDPIEIPLLQLAIINKLVADIGELKDKAEAMIEVEKMLRDADVKGEEREALKRKLMKKLGAEEIDHQKESKKFMKKLDKTNLLKSFAKSLEELNQ